MSISFKIFFFPLLAVTCCSKDVLQYNDIPPWIYNHPCFQKPKEVNSLIEGNGKIIINKNENLGWVVKLNNDTGYGVNVTIQKLFVGTNAEDYLLIAGWPISRTSFKEIKIFTGAFTNLQIHIPNSKRFFILFNGEMSHPPPELILTYQRFGKPYKMNSSSQDRPPKKETLFEIHLKGKKPEDYTNLNFLMKLKEALRTVAERYCKAQQIPFNNSITSTEMVFFNKISFCPFEWPERDICAAVEHSIFVSGVKAPDESMIMNYELTAEHLRDMWQKNDLLEVHNLGITVFKLPEPFETILWWMLITGGAIALAMVILLAFYKVNRYTKKNRKGNPGSVHVINEKKISKRCLPTHQKIPSFMVHTKESEKEEKLEESSIKLAHAKPLNYEKTNVTDVLSSPIKNFVGSILFRDDKAVEDDDDNTEVCKK